MLTEVKVKLNEDKYLLSALTKACRLKNERIRARLPISKDLLQMILNKITRYYDQQPYLACLYRAMISTGYFGMLRVGELTSGSHPILAKDVHISSNKKKLMLILHSSKTHCEADKPQIIKISSVDYDQHSSKSKVTKHNCPYQILRDYVAVRPGFIHPREPFFIFFDHTLVKPLNLRSILHQMLNLLNLDSKSYNTMSLRSGRASDLLCLGVSVETIKKLGRWKSTTVFNYLH